MEKYFEDLFEKTFTNMKRRREAEKENKDTCECVCGGTISFGRASNNNHLHTSCDKCGWRTMH